MKKTIIGGIAAAALALAGAATANASPASENGYLKELVSNGITIDDAVRAINRGYQICNLLTHEDGNAAARDLFLRPPDPQPELDPQPKKEA